MEDRREEVKKRNKIEERRRILKTDLPPIHIKKLRGRLVPLLLLPERDDLSADQYRQ